MNICKTEQEYIDQIYLAAQKACKKYGYLPSVLIGQACLENGYGIPDYWDNPQIEALIKNWNMVGIKSELLNKSWTDIGLSVWNGQSLTKQTPEVYGGKQVTITDNFRKYRSAEESFVDYLLFLTYASNNGAGGTPKYGKEVLSIKDPETLIKAVNSRGYTTGTTYPTSVMKIVRKHNLTKYDDLSKVTASTLVPPALKKKEEAAPAPYASNVKKLAAPRFIDNRAASKSQVPAWRSKSDKKYIVVHFLGVVGQNYDLWDNGYGATFTIAWNGDVYYTADYTAVTWQCGGQNQGESKDGNGVAPHRFHGQCTNYNSVSIETCVKRTDNKYEGDDNDDKWYFTEESQESLVWAVSKMMDDLNIPIDRVIRHFDVTGKICPNPYVKNNGLNGNWTWDEFKANLKQYRKDGTITVPDRSKSPAKGGNTVAIELRQGSRDDEVKTMQTMLIKCGYSCGSYGADGVFGASTDAALRSFQKAKGLLVDGVYGPNTQKALLAAYKSKTTTTKAASKTKKATDITVDQFLASCKNVMNTARKNNYKYGDSHAANPTTDGIISCDRMIAKALYDLGFTDQRTGGEVVSTLDTWLKNHGFVRSTSSGAIKKGSIILVKHEGSTSVTHAFVATAFNKNTWVTSRYDAGSKTRINTVQPLKNVSWGYRKDDIIVYNIPSKTPATTTKATSNWKAIGTGTSTYSGQLKVREKASLTSKVLRKLNKGNRFEVDGKTSGKFTHVKVVDQIGWVKTKYVKRD